MSDMLSKIISDVEDRVSLLEERMEHFVDMVLNFFGLILTHMDDDTYNNFKKEFPKTAKDLGM